MAEELFWRHRWKCRNWPLLYFDYPLWKLWWNNDSEFFSSQWFDFTCFLKSRLSGSLPIGYCQINFQHRAQEHNQPVQLDFVAVISNLFRVVVFTSFIEHKSCAEVFNRKKDANEVKRPRCSEKQSVFLKILWWISLCFRIGRLDQVIEVVTMSLSNTFNVFQRHFVIKTSIVEQTLFLCGILLIHLY